MNKEFTKEELELLRNHPGIEFASEKTVRFSAEFKQKAYDWYITGGTMSEFFRENGIDPDILGPTRIYSFTNNIKNKKLRDNSFEDSRQFNSRRLKDLQDPESRITELETKVSYMQQEIEFLKKNLKADMEARELWASRHQLMKNSK